MPTFWCEVRVDVKPSDVYEILYIPSEGTKLIFNGIEQCLIEDDEFAKVFFGIWLSDHAISKKCKNRLLDW